MKKLPDKPSELILLALEDLEKAEKTEGYIVDMTAWHVHKRVDDVCLVCFAGAVMAMTLKVKRETSKNPSRFKGDTKPKLEALDMFRRGRVSQGLDVLCNKSIITLEEVHKIGLDLNQQVSDYYLYPEAFKVQMYDLSNDLKKEGL